MKNFILLTTKFFRSTFLGTGNIFKWVALTTRGRILTGTIAALAGIVQITGISVKDMVKEDSVTPMKSSEQVILDSLNAIIKPSPDTLKPAQPTYQISTTGSNSPGIIANGNVNQSIGVDNAKTETNIDTLK